MVDAVLSDVWRVFAATIWVCIAAIWGKEVARMKGSLYKRAWTLIWTITVAGIIAWVGYGRHSEDSDPMFGGGDEVVDFEPSREQQTVHGLVVFLTALIPGALSFANEAKRLANDGGREEADAEPVKYSSVTKLNADEVYTTSRPHRVEAPKPTTLPPSDLLRSSTPRSAQQPPAQVRPAPRHSPCEVQVPPRVTPSRKVLL